MQTIWFSPTEYVTGDPSVRISYPFVSHPSTIVTCTTPGDYKWISLGLRLPAGVQLEEVSLCYQVSNPRSYISQVRLSEMSTPDQATVCHDDPTNLTSTAPACYTSKVGGFISTAAVSLELRLNFDDKNDQIMLGAVGVKVQPKSDIDSWRLTGNAGVNPATHFLGTTDNQPLVIKTNGVEALRVNHDGKVGIGTASPADALHVKETVGATIARFEGNGQGSIVFFDGAATERGRLGFGSAGHLLSDALCHSLAIRSEAALHLGVGSSVALTIREIGYGPGTGYVGIGTTKPTAILTVAGEDSPRIHITSNSPGPNPSRTWGLLSFTDGNFYITDITASVDRLVITTDGTIGVAGNLAIKGPRPWADVRAYGAKGDGITDDTAAIQSALNAVKLAGGGVFLPAGTYLISATLAVDSCVNISGAGRNAIIRASGASFHVFTLTSAAIGSHLTGFQIQGAATTDATNQFAIFTNGASIPTNITIDHLLISGPNDTTGCNSGIKLDAGANDWTISHNYFDRLIGITSGHGYGVLLGAALRNIITHNHFTGAAGQGRHAVYLSAGASYNIVAHNIVKDFNEAAFPINTYWYQPASQSNQIVNNTIINGGQLTHDSGAIGIYGNSSYNRVASNTIRGYQGEGIIITDGGQRGLCIGNEVVGNSVDNVARFGIVVMGAKDTDVRSNKVCNASQSASGAYGGIDVRSAGTFGIERCDDTKIIGNTSWGSSQRDPFSINPTSPVPTNTIVIGNVFRAGKDAGWVRDLNMECLPTIADLKALAAGVTSCLNVLGYHTPGDGGGGSFYWDASSTAADNGGTVIVPDSSPTIGRWKRLVEGPLSVKWCGAVGDGATNETANDTDAIQAAMAAVSVTGGTVCFPPGTYIIKATIQIPSNVLITGAKAATVVKAGADAINLFTIDGEVTRKSNIVIERITFQGNNTSLSNLNGNGIHAQFCSNATIRDCEFHNFGDKSAADAGGSAIHFYLRNENINILYNFIDGGMGVNNGNDINVYSVSGDVLIHGNRCYSRNSNGIYTNATSQIGKVIITGNICKNHTRHGIIPVYAGTGQLDTIVAHNLCIDNDSTGIYVQTQNDLDLTDNPASGFVVHGNIIDSCSGGGTNWATLAGGLVVFGKGRKIVTGNFIFNTGRDSSGKARAGYPREDGGGLDDVTESTALRVGNQDNSIISENFIDTSIGRGISLSHRIVYAVIKNNRIINTAEAAIHLTTGGDFPDGSHVIAKYIEFSGNYIDNSASSGDGIYLNYIQFPAERVLIRDNIIKGNGKTGGKTGIYAWNSFTGAIEHNIIDGWGTAVDFFYPAIANLIGSQVTFNFNTLSNSDVAVHYYINNVDTYAFGIGNKYENNTTQEKAEGVIKNYRNATSLEPQKVFYDSSPPPTGVWRQGDVVYNTNPGAPTPNNVIGWVCTVGGTPSTWKAFGVVIT